MELTALQIYAVMQLDTIIKTLDIVTFISICGLGVWVFLVCMFNNLDDDLRIQRKPRPLPRRWMWVVLTLLITTGMVLPDSRTAAAMLVLPPLVNDGLPAVQEEARELYQLAREALEQNLRPTDAPDGVPDAPAR